MFLALCTTHWGGGIYWYCCRPASRCQQSPWLLHSFFLSFWLLCMHNQHQCCHNAFGSKFTCILHYNKAKKGCACLWNNLWCWWLEAGLWGIKFHPQSPGGLWRTINLSFREALCWRCCSYISKQLLYWRQSNASSYHHSAIHLHTLKKNLYFLTCGTCVD